MLPVHCYCCLLWLRLWLRLKLKLRLKLWLMLMLHSTQKQGYTVLANPTCKQLTGLNSFLKQAGRWSRETYDNQNLAIELSSPITSKHQPHIPHLHRATMECYANGGLWAGVRCPLCQGLSLTRMV